MKKTFWEMVRLMEEVPPMGGGMPPGPPMGGPPGMPPGPPMGGAPLGGPPLGGPPGLGGPPLGGGPAPGMPQPAQQLKPLSVWQVLGKILDGEPIKKQSGQEKGDMVKNAQLAPPSSPAAQPPQPSPTTPGLDPMMQQPPMM